MVNLLNQEESDESVIDFDQVQFSQTNFNFLETENSKNVISNTSRSYSLIMFDALNT